MTMNDAEISYANIEKLKKIANDFENQTGNNIYDFVLNLKNTNDNEAYSAIPKLSVESVKIMTIHKSKGLEFNNVFVAGIGGYIKPNLSDFDFIEDSSFIKLPVKNKHYSVDFSALNTDYNKKSEFSEKRRLLYVALTRASNNLILSGEHTKEETYRSYLDKYFHDETKKYKADIISEDTEGLIKIDDIENKFIDTYFYGLAIKREEEIDIKDAQSIKEKIDSLSKEDKKENNNQYIKNINPSLNNIFNKNYVNITKLLDRKISKLENDINNTDNEYNEDIELISYKDIGIIIHKMLEYFNFDKYNKEKDQYLEKVKSYIIKSNNHYSKEQLTESLNTAFKKLFENHHIQNILNGDEEIVAEYLDNTIINDCKKWEVTDFSQVAILVRSTKMQEMIDGYLDIPHRVVISTPLDHDLNPRSHLFAQLLQYYFDEGMPFMSVVDYYMDFALLSSCARKRLLGIRDEIRSVNKDDMIDALPRLFKNIANILLPKYQEGSSIKHLNSVLNSKDWIDSYRSFSANEVVIMTLHKSKGLEFDIVYHLNMNEFEIPFKQYKNGVACYPNEAQDLDLHYVGVTRAKKLCVLVSNSTRHNSKGEAKKGEPSIFLSRNGVEALRNNYYY